MHKELERELAEFLNKENCTISVWFSNKPWNYFRYSGRNDIIFLIKKIMLVFTMDAVCYAQMVHNHADMEDLERLLAKADPNKGKLIVTDGVFSMGGDIANLPEICRLARKYGARVMVDDAHGFGVLGPRGRGTAEHFGLEDEVDIIMGTFSKSLASLGGYVVASRDVVDYIRHNSRPYIFCAAIPPANTAAALAALNIIKREPERIKALHDISNYVRKGLRERGLKIRESETPIIPIYTYTPIRTMVACNVLFENGVYVNPVIPPATPQNECLIRTSYTATHTKELMDKAMDIIAKVLHELPDFEEDQ